jgi:alkanesulfonate monooxygenase SsuD/methylene tetrahydromethanopterin reductase-like flavin-dependent oxidoreductase (luciferase family)
VVIRSGVVLPTFRDSPDDALAAADAAVAAGIDGLFCYDHLWPMGQPQRPALAPFPLLGALAARFGPSHDGPFLGTLVARIGLVPHAVLAAEFRALARLAPGRVIAGLGTGDSLSAEENRAYGIPFHPAAQRRTEVVALARELKGEGITVWVAGGPAGRVDEARAAGAGLNVWDADPERSTGAEPLEVSWAGPPPASAPVMAETVDLMAGAGATWVVFGWPVDVEALATAAHTASPDPLPGPSSEAVGRQP